MKRSFSPEGGNTSPESPAFVDSHSVVEVRYLDEGGNLTKNSVDLFDIQHSLPRSGKEQAHYCQRNASTGVQVAFFCIACTCPVGSIPNLTVHCTGKKHNKNLTERAGSTAAAKKPKMDQGGPQERSEGLTLVNGPGIAEMKLNENLVEDMWNFQRENPNISEDFFSSDQVGGFQKFFHCKLCEAQLIGLGNIRMHCEGRDHVSKVLDFQKAKLEITPPVLEGETDPFKRLKRLLQGVQDPCVGLEKIFEWWESSGSCPPIYTCQMCRAWGSSGVMFQHITSEKHRRSYLVSRYPILESMIQGMDTGNLMERAKEEEDKYGGYLERDYDAIESVENNDKYMELSRMNEEADKDTLLAPNFTEEESVPQRSVGNVRRGVTLLSEPHKGDRGRFVGNNSGRIRDEDRSNLNTHRGGFDGGNRGGFVSRNRGGLDGPNHGGFDGPNRGDMDGPSIDDNPGVNNGGYNFNRGNRARFGGNRGGFDGGNRGGLDGGNRGGLDGGNRGGNRRVLIGANPGSFDGGNLGGFDGGNRGGFDAGNRGGFDAGNRGGFDGGNRGGFGGDFNGGNRGGFSGDRGGFDGDLGGYPRGGRGRPWRGRGVIGVRGDFEDGYGGRGGIRGRGGGFGSDGPEFRGAASFSRGGPSGRGANFNRGRGFGGQQEFDGRGGFRGRGAAPGFDQPPPGFSRGGQYQRGRGGGPPQDSNTNVPAFASREFCENQINNFINGPESLEESNFNGGNSDGPPFSDSGINSSHRGHFGGQGDSGPSRGGPSFRGRGGPFRGHGHSEGPTQPIVGSGPLYARPHGTSDEARPWQDRSGQLRPISRNNQRDEIHRPITPPHVQRPRGARTPPGSPPRRHKEDAWKNRQESQRRVSPPRRGRGHRGAPPHRREPQHRRFNSRSPRRGHRAPPSDDEDPPEACYAVSGDQEDFGYGTLEKVSQEEEGKKKEKKEKNTTLESGEDWSGAGAGGRYDDGGFEDRHDSRRDSGDEEERLRRWGTHYDKRYYGTEGGRDNREVAYSSRDSGGQFGRDYEMNRGNRPDRYYGPESTEPRSRKKSGRVAESEDHYEGPTIFDRVYRKPRAEAEAKRREEKRKKKEERKERGERGEEKKTLSKDEMESQWREYKEKTELRIRREKAKLEAYERKMREITTRMNDEKIAPVNPGEYEAKKKRTKPRSSRSSKRSSRASSRTSISPPKAYGGSRSHYPSSDEGGPGSSPPPPPPPTTPPRVTRPMTPVTPPPGSTLKPIIAPSGRPSNSSYDYDPYYDEFVSRTKASGHTPEDKCETEFDPY